MSPRHLVKLLRASLLVAFLTALALTLAYQVRSPVVIDIGGKQDAPFLARFFDPEQDPEQTYRWTRAQSRIELDGQAIPAPWTLRLRLNGYRPNRPARVQIQMNGVTVKNFQAHDGWEIYTLEGNVPPDPLTGDNILFITNDTFVPQEEIEGSADPRKLGVATDWLELTPARSSAFIGNDSAWLDFGMTPILPPIATVASWSIGVALLYASARGIGLPRRWVNIAFAIFILALAFGFAFARPYLGYASTAFLTLSFVLAILALLLVLLLPRLAARILPRAAPFDARTLSLLSGIILLSIGLKWGGAWYPQFRSSDLNFHAHRLEFVAQGNLFFTSELPDAARRVVPYPSALYIVLAPFTPWTDEYTSLLLIFDVLADAAALLALYFAAQTLFANSSTSDTRYAIRDTPAALLTTFLFAFNPVSFWIYSWGNHTNIFGQAAATILFAVLLTQPLTRPRNFLLALFLFLLASLAHLGVFLSLHAFLPLAVLVRFLARDTDARRETFALLLLFLLGLVLAWLLYYAEFTTVLFTQAQTFANDFVAGRTGSVGGSSSLARVTNVARYTLEQLGWVLLLTGIAGAPLAWRSFDTRARSIWLAWLLVGVLFGLLTLGASFSTRYTLWAASTLALSGGLALTWLFQRSRALQYSAYIFCALAFSQTLWVWIDRVWNAYH
ncbi:MAG TPA: hypothetical protein VFD70_03715 [Anaerolineae bacterium]|nr:hypothetical protein [Anaerolineae bacterium]